MFDKKHIHFIGVGGIGMSALAQVLLQKGFKVSGSDLSKNSITEKLKKKIRIYSSHNEKNIDSADIVVHSTAIKQNNIELRSAKKKNIPIFSRAMMLAEIMRLKKSITIAGSHGKTTTTSLIASILEFSGLDPTILSGGIINSLKINAKLGKGEWIVAEADESDGSFTFLPSTIAVINNIDMEHVDFYKNEKHLNESFLKYADKIPFYGFLALGIDNKNVKKIEKKLSKKKIYTFGLSKEANFSATKIKIVKQKELFFTDFELVENLKDQYLVKKISIPLLGSHNIQNVLGSICVARGLGISYQQIKNALKNFQGVKRRFSIISKSKKNLIIDDYAHHPSEISATIKTLKDITSKKIISIFEPHRYSRLSSMFNDFIKSFYLSDKIFLLPVYSAGEKKKKIDSNYFCKKLIQKYPNKKIFSYINDETLFKQLMQNIYEGDNIIFLGAGLSSKTAIKFSKTFKND